MAISRTKITSQVTNQILVAKQNKRLAGRDVGGISKISITNSHNTTLSNVSLTIYDGTNTYYLCRAKIPAQSKLVLDDGDLSYDGKLYDLRVTTDSATHDLTIAIK